jgi:hypothetical protein
MNYYWQPTRIQNLASVVSTEAQIFYANSPQDMERLNPQPNILYIGVNIPNKEVYLKQMNGMGLIDFDTYVRKSGEQQKNDLTKILERIDQLENNMKGNANVIQSTNGATSNEYADKGNVTQSPDNATVQSNNVG